MLNRLGQLELAYGDPERAKRIFGELAAGHPHRGYLTNLGLVRFLRHDFEGAVASYRQALAVGAWWPRSPPCLGLVSSFDNMRVDPVVRSLILELESDR